MQLEIIPSSMELFNAIQQCIIRSDGLVTISHSGGRSKSPFHPYSWLMVLGFFLLLGTLFTLQSFANRQAERTLRILDIVVNFVNAIALVKGEDLVGTGAIQYRYTRSWRMLYMTATFGTMLICTFYAATLASRTISPPIDQPFDDIGILATKMVAGQYKLATRSMSSLTFEHILRSNYSAYEAINQAINLHGFALISANESVEGFLMREPRPHVYVGSTEFLDQNLLRKSCEFRVIQSDDYRMDYAFPFPKNSSLARRFTYAINSIRPLDILELLKKRYTAVRKCSAEIEDRIRAMGTQHQLSLRQCQYAFLPILVGGVLASLALGLERGRQRAFHIGRDAWLRGRDRHVH